MLGLANIPFGVFFQLAIWFEFFNYLSWFLAQFCFSFWYFFFFSLFLRYTFDYKIRKSEINENNNFRLKHAFALYGKLFLRTRKTNIYFSMSHVRASETGRDWAREGEREGAICGDIKYKFLLSCFYRGGFYFFFGPLGNWLNRTENSLDILIFRNENRTETASQREMRKKDGANARQKRWCERGEQEKMKRGRRKRSRQSQ